MAPARKRLLWWGDRTSATAHDQAYDHEKETASLGEVRPSEVRRVAPPAPEVRSSERPTLPVPRCTVSVPADDPYRVVLDGRLRESRRAPALDLTSGRPGRPSSATHDLIDALGSIDRVPYRVCSDAEVRAAPIDNTIAFVLSLVDGATSIESIIDASPVAMHRVLLALTQLVSLRLIGLDPAGASRRLPGRRKR